MEPSEIAPNELSTDWLMFISSKSVEDYSTDQK
jgi:hypothetical protein